MLLHSHKPHSALATWRHRLHPGAQLRTLGTLTAAPPVWRWPGGDGRTGRLDGWRLEKWYREGGMGGRDYIIWYIITTCFYSIWMDTSLYTLFKYHYYLNSFCFFCMRWMVFSYEKDHLYIYIYIHMQKRSMTVEWILACTCVYIYIYYMCICICICIYVCVLVYV